MGEEEVQITLVGHSMGCIILNELVRQNDHLPFQNIVYMAAACSIENFEKSIIRYMERYPEANFYNLMLDPIAETRERMIRLFGFEFGPRGSLLVWIDNYLTKARTPLDLTLGRWVNIMRSLFVIPPDLRSRVHLKTYGIYGSDVFKYDLAPAGFPMHHGDFSQLHFWEPEVWEVGNYEAH